MKAPIIPLDGSLPGGPRPHQQSPPGGRLAGSLAMANSGPDTNGSQFFVVVSDEGGKQLQNPSYSLFGQVTTGLYVVQKIEADGSPEGQPKALHQIIKVTITEA